MSILQTNIKVQTAIDQPGQTLLKIVPLVSGGINSTVLLYRELITKGHEVYPLAINYGQKNLGKERTALKKTYDHLTSIVDEHTVTKLFPIKFLDVSMMRYLFRSGITWPDIEIPDHDAVRDGDWNPSIVPFRDPFLISIAAATAYLVGAERVSIGNNNANLDYMNSLKQVLSTGSRNQVKLDTPFADMSKEEVIRMGMILQVPFESTYGCYRDKSHPCGTCDSCFERKRAFKALGVEDKTIYIDDIRAKKNCCG